MSQAGIVDIEGSHPQIPTSFVTNMGTAIPIGNVLEVLGTTVAAHSIPLETTGSGNTVTIVAQYASGAASSVGTNAGFASFSSTQFSVDANGYVTLNGAVVAETITGNTGGPLSPVAGNWNIFGSSVAAGTTPVHTAGSGNTLTVDVQISQAIAATDATKIGLAAFNSTYFTVDANGFVSLNGSMVGETITGNTGGALSPTAGNWNILGTSTAAGTTPVQTAGSGSTLTIQVQKSQAISSTDATKVGLATFNSTFFTVDGNGFVSINGAAIAETITGNVGGALSPTAGNWNILGTSTAAGTTPVQTSGSGSTLTVQVQKSQAIAATDATKVGLANFNSADFSVDANGFVSAASTGYIRTITGTTGGAESPAAGGNFNLLGATASAGTTPVVIAGSANTETIKVQISQAIASTNATNVGLSAFSSTYFTVDANGFVTLSSIGTLLTFNGDTGSATPSAGVITFNANSNSGSTVLFSATSHTVSLKVSDAVANMFIGAGTGNAAYSGIGGNTGLGAATLAAITSGQYNIGVGYSVLNALTTGSYNVAVGQASLNANTGSSNTAIGTDSLYQLVGGSNNISLGSVAGGSYTGSESSNICIGNSGTAAESHVIRIGTQGSGTGQQNSCYIAGIEGVSVSNKNYVTINTSTGQLGSEASSTLFSINVQTFTSSGTYTPTAGMDYCIIECVGGGGGGGGCGTPSTGYNVSAGGGGGGGYARKFSSAATIGASQTVTVGAAGSAGSAGNNAGGNGGDSSLGAICVGKGGTGGGGSSGGAVGAGGAGGVAGTGDFTFVGQQGMGGGFLTLATGSGTVAGGGNSYFGYGGSPVTVASGNTTGNAGALYGGGGGAGLASSGGGTQGGAAGAKGVVVVTEFIIA